MSVGLSATPPPGEEEEEPAAAVVVEAERDRRSLVGARAGPVFFF